jgi:hypothetical protein
MLFSFLLASCGLSEGAEDETSKGNKYEVSNPEAEVTEDDFIYRLVSEKDEYNAKEPVSIYAELEYIGNKESVTIYHAASPFHFPMYEKTRDYTIGFGMEEPLLNTILMKGEPFREEYQGSGGYGSDDDKEYINFIKNIMKNQFPAGYYEVNGFADFFVKNNDTEKKDYKINAEIDFKVKDNDNF